MAGLLGFSFCFLVPLTIVSLSDAILDATTLCQIGDFGPIFIWVGVGTKSAAIVVTGGARARTGIVRSSRAMHCVWWMPEMRRKSKDDIKKDQQSRYPKVR